jgi:AraC-like DNA-binding protein
MEEFCAADAAITDSDFTPLSRELIVTPPTAALAKLQRLHAEAGDLAENAPGILANADAAQALIHAMVACLSTTERAGHSLAYRRHEKIMRRFHAAIAGRSEDAVYIAELCTMLGVPERTPRVCCNESLGMGPKRYRLLRRMKLARQALRKGAAATTSVTEIAAKFGFWNFGRFAVE